MITVEVRDAAKVAESMAEVEIYCDSEGLALLQKQLEHLKSGSSHIHLMTPTWAGMELGEKPFGNGTNLVNHLRITMISPIGNDRQE